MVHSTTGEWAGTTVVDGPGHVRLADTPQADIHQADTLPIPGVALLVEAPQATAAEAPAADPDLSPEADLDPHCLPLAGGALQAQLVPLPGLLPLPVPVYVCQHLLLHDKLHSASRPNLIAAHSTGGNVRRLSSSNCCRAHAFRLHGVVFKGGCRLP